MRVADGLAGGTDASGRLAGSAFQQPLFSSVTRILNRAASELIEHLRSLVAVCCGRPSRLAVRRASRCVRRASSTHLIRSVCGRRRRARSCAARAHACRRVRSLLLLPGHAPLLPLRMPLPRPNNGRLKLLHGASCPCPRQTSATGARVLGAPRHSCLRPPARSSSTWRTGAVLEAARAWPWPGRDGGRSWASETPAATRRTAAARMRVSPGGRALLQGCMVWRHAASPCCCCCSWPQTRLASTRSCARRR